MKLKDKINWISEKFKLLHQHKYKNIDLFQEKKTTLITLVSAGWNHKELDKEIEKINNELCEFRKQSINKILSL